ncbi:MAG: peptidoglycan recognition family protein [Acutalibacteraceae bacterium]|nr:peptidoglycan recognition family protein [Acutalibacteraceae bacterium]
MSPKGIVVHSTGVNNPYLKRYVDSPNEVGINKYGNHWNTAKPDGRSVCVHAFIGYDRNNNISVAEILPLDICCWGVGSGVKGSYNYSPAYIQFEICEDGLTDKVYYQNAFAVAAEYCAKLCETYGIEANKIVGHIEAYKQGYGSNHSDPEHWMKNFGETMDDFRKAVSDILVRSKMNNDNKIEITNAGNTAISKMKDGDLVSVAKDAVYDNGKPVPEWVKLQNWYVKGKPMGDRVVIDRNENGTNSICSPINQKYLKVVNSTNKNDSNLSDTPISPYRVKVITDTLNIRKDAGTNNAIVGCITDNGVYTIVAEKSGKGATLWGKLKSGAGWISLDYTKKI